MAASEDRAIELVARRPRSLSLPLDENLVLVLPHIEYAAALWKVVALEPRQRKFLAAQLRPFLQMQKQEAKPPLVFHQDLFYQRLDEFFSISCERYRKGAASEQFCHWQVRALAA